MSLLLGSLSMLTVSLQGRLSGEAERDLPTVEVPRRPSWPCSS